MQSTTQTAIGPRQAAGLRPLAQRTRGRVWTWQRSLRWLLYYMPFSGVLPLALYPHGAPGTLLKEVVFMAPAYVAAYWLFVARRQPLAVPGLPRVLFGAFTALVLVEAVNPRLVRPLVGPIGAYIWLFYIPLLPLGYHMFARKRDLQHLLKWMTILALFPNVLGIAEAVLIYTGKAHFVYSLYGAAAAATNQDFFALPVGSGHLSRISGIFTFVAQYYFFTTASIAIAYAAWRGNRGDPTMRWLGPTAIVIAVFAMMVSGLRAAFVFGPILFVLIAVLEGISLTRLLIVILASAVAILATAFALGLSLTSLASLTGGHTVNLFGFFGQGVRFALHHSLFGIGSGADTNQARYAFPTASYGQVYAATGGVWYESWYLKALIELGVVGLALLVTLIVRLLDRSITAHRSACRDPEARSMSAAFLAVFIWTLLFSIKSAGIDEDPLNVYTWLFLGLQWWLGDLVRT